MLALIEMNLLPGGKRGVARPKPGRKPSAPKFGGLREMTSADPLVVIVVVLAFAAVGSLIVLFLQQSVKMSGLEEELAIQRQDSIRYAEAIAAADSLEARRDTIQQKAAIIREIDSDRFVWAHIMDEVSAALPDFTWLTGIQQTGAVPAAPAAAAAQATPTVEFRIDGMTGLTQALTRFMRDLEDSPFIRDVRLVSQEQIQQGQRLVHNFVLMASYQQPDSSVIVTEPIIITGE
jgi:Tfp pilus assembly protein PilN